MSETQRRLRVALAQADFPTVLGWREDDELLRALNTGLSSYYASQFARSAATLDSAALLADDRITKSVSRHALSLITNDLALPYQPRRTERLFIAYYGVLAHARLEAWEDAAVEARRLSGLLMQYAPDRTDAERATHATLHYLAGVVFERAGERAEAQVAYRNARALLRVQEESASRSGVNGGGDVLIVVERGFVAHRATESISVNLGESERDSLRGQDHREDGYWLSVAFPSVRRSRRASGDPVIYVDGVSTTSSRVVSLLDDAASADERRERAELLARAVMRAAAKYTITKAVKDEKGEVAGRIANIGASLLERADVRSWHLLPQEIALVRVRAPTGQHQLQLAIGGPDASRVELGPITVHPGLTTITAVRLWREPTMAQIATR